MNYFIAHRGVHNKNIKENCLEAFWAAIDSDLWDGFECDIRTSLDGVFLICHNHFEGTSIISKTKYSKLKKKYGLVSLESVLNLNSPKIFLLEIKESNLDLDKFREVLEKHKDKNIYVMSFSKKVILNLRNKGVKFKLGVLNYVFNSDEDYSCYDFICLLESVASTRLISYFHERGIEVFLYGVHHLEKTTRKYDNIYIILDKNVL